MHLHEESSRIVNLVIGPLLQNESAADQSEPEFRFAGCGLVANESAAETCRQVMKMRSKKLLPQRCYLKHSEQRAVGGGRNLVVSNDAAGS